MAAMQAKSEEEQTRKDPYPSPFCTVVHLQTQQALYSGRLGVATSPVGCCHLRVPKSLSTRLSPWKLGSDGLHD